jgi:hypothetical protein
VTPTFAPSGECFRGCLATLLDTPLESIPHFPAPVEIAARTWLRETHNLHLITSRFKGTRAAEGAVCIAVGVSPRNPERLHAVVGRIDGTGRHVSVVHDPHIDQTGIVGAPQVLHFVVRMEME